MSMAAGTGILGRALAGRQAPAGADGAKVAPAAARDVLAPDAERPRERFIPVTRFALMDRLTHPDAWPVGQAEKARRFFKYLDFWRQQQYSATVMRLEQSYEPFSPDSDLLITRQFTDTERKAMQQRVVRGVAGLLAQANYERIDPAKVEMIVTKDSFYGLDLFVDLKAFEELLVFYRGASTRKDQKRLFRKFLRKSEFGVPMFQRLFVLFKLKPHEVRVAEVMREQKIERKEAEKIVRRLRSLIPAEVKSDCIYMKLFKNMPRSDIEMIFPNTRVRFRLMDKIKLGLTGGGAFGMGAFGAAGKIALAASNPIAAAGAVAGLGGIAFRQAVNFMNQRQRYMVIMAQNLYFHAMADNRGVMIKLANRAAAEDTKEEILLYSVLAKETVRRDELGAVDRAIEQYICNSFGVAVNFDLEDALGRLIADGIVTEEPDGTLRTLPPEHAARHIDEMWDSFLDRLPDIAAEEGIEIEEDEPPAVRA